MKGKKQSILSFGFAPVTAHQQENNSKMNNDLVHMKKKNTQARCPKELNESWTKVMQKSPHDESVLFFILSKITTI